MLFFVFLVLWKVHVNYFVQKKKRKKIYIILPIILCHTASDHVVDTMRQLLYTIRTKRSAVSQYNITIRFVESLTQKTFGCFHQYKDDAIFAKILAGFV